LPQVRATSSREAPVSVSVAAPRRASLSFEERQALKVAIDMAKREQLERLTHEPGRCRGCGIPTEESNPNISNAECPVCYERERARRRYRQGYRPKSGRCSECGGPCDPRASRCGGCAQSRRPAVA
jgi:predicted Zn-ribbon and HTH transcriptional regulator